jgi:ParB/RepB/Spo0J family partition protein
VHVEPGLNARAAEESELDGLVASIARHGVLQPLLVRERDEGGAWLVAGHRRLTAARAAGLSEVPVVLVDGERFELTAVENLQRAQLSPLEEARAFQALADAGRTPRGIATALGVSQRRVIERLAILALTGAGQAAAGDGSLPLSAVSVLGELTALSGALADRVLATALELGDAGALARDPGWVLQRAVGFGWEEGAALGWLAVGRRIPVAALGIEDAELVARAQRIAALTFEPAGVRLGEEQLAQAVAARCAWSRGGFGVVGRDWLATQAPALIAAELERVEAELAERRSTSPGPGGESTAAASGNGGDAPSDPDAQARAAERAQAAEDRRRAAALNDGLAAKLLKGLASAPWDRDAAMFVAHTSRCCSARSSTPRSSATRNCGRGCRPATRSTGRRARGEGRIRDRPRIAHRARRAPPPRIASRDAHPDSFSTDEGAPRGLDAP